MLAALASVHMIVRLSIFAVSLFAAAGLEGQPGPSHERGMRHGRHHGSMVRHHYVAQHGLDEQYTVKLRPRPPTAQDLESGRALFVRHCASCHGAHGTGDGEAAAGLDPPPANLAFAARRPMASDGYLYWTIAEGGVPIGSAMPPFKDVLDDEGVWQIIAYLRKL